MWSKSSYCGGGNCVEVWRKSSRSADATGDCVEVSCTCGDVVRVRDSKDRGGPVLTFSRGTWAEFVGRIKDGDLSTD